MPTETAVYLVRESARARPARLATNATLNDIAQYNATDMRDVSGALEIGTKELVDR